MKRCGQVAAGTLVTNSTNSQTYRLEMTAAVRATADIETLLVDMQKALQRQVAPNLTNCVAYDDKEAEERRQLQQGQRVENVVFGPRSAGEFGTLPSFVPFH
jgi:NAD(P)H-hydrate repair Nnr-like enzyme with NAD(P)H-hydrate dehydratase domain